MNQNMEEQTTKNINTIYEMFADQVRQHPDAPAVITDEKTWSFQELKDLANKIAGSLPAGNRMIGIILDHSVMMIAAMLGVLQVRAAYVPAEPTFPIERIRFMMKESNARVILTSHAYEELLEGMPLLFVEDLQENASAVCLAKSNAPAYVLYTSGSTGEPKGVVVMNKNVCHYARAFDNEFHPTVGDVMLQYSVCSFDIFVEEVFASLLNGAAIYIPDSKVHDDRRLLMEKIKEHHVTEISGFPYLLKDIDQDVAEGLYELPDSLRLLISGGDVIRENYVSHLLDQCTIYNTYGPSETTVCATYFACKPGTALEDGTFPIGKPVTGAAVVLLDQQGYEVPNGSVGEICVLGSGVSAGYLDASKNTDFITLSDGRRMYRTGDLGRRLEDGNLAFLGRRDEQVMILGKRVEPKEVESILCQAPGVRNAVVTAWEDEEHLYHLKAYVAGMPDFDLEQTISYMKQYLTEFMIPECIVQVDSIPVTDNGKPDLQKLLAMELQQGPCQQKNQHCACMEALQ